MPETTEKVTAYLGSPVNLENLKGGKVETLFSHAIAAVIRNIKDPDSQAEAKRSIALKLTLEPNPSRNYALTKIALTCSCLGHTKPMGTGLLLNGSGSTATAQEQLLDGEDDHLTKSPDLTHAIALASLVGGAVDEAFQVELQRVVANIRDLNTVQSNKRSLTVLFTFAPSEERNYAGVKVQVKSCCSGHNIPLLSSLIISARNGQITAYEQYVEQGQLPL